MILKRLIRSLFFRKRYLVPGLTLAGQASEFVAEVLPGSDKWKKSFSSYKIEIERVTDDQVAYYSWYVGEDGYEYILGTVKLSSKNAFISNIRSIKLLVLEYSHERDQAQHSN